jgi:hypothetical protein
MKRALLTCSFLSALTLLFASGASAEIIYTHGQTAPPASGTWVQSSLWSMGDSGSTPELLLSPAQAPSSQQAICCASTQPNSSTALFEGFDYQYAGNAAGGYGAYYEGLYVLSGGTATRLSPAPASDPGVSSYDAPAVLTANGQVIFQRQTAEYAAGNPGEQVGATWSMDEASIGGGTSSPWLWVGDNGDNAYPGSNRSFPPATFASDPNDPSLVAYSGGQLYIDNQSNTDAVGVATQPAAYANGGLAWSPDGTELVDIDNTPAGNVGTPGADGYSPGLWMFSSVANGAHHLVLTSPGAGDLFSSPVFVGQNEIAFVADNNIWEVSASCNACTFPGGAHQLTTDGTGTAPDSDPTWTSDTITGPKTTPPPPTVTLKLSLSASDSQKVVKQKGVIATIKCNVICAFAAIAGIQIKGSKKELDSKQASGQLRAGGSKKVTLKFSSGQLKTIEKALKKHEKVTALLVAEAKDLAGKTVQVHGRFTVKH